MSVLLLFSVALTSCGPYEYLNPTSDGMIKFPKKRTSVGVNNISLFINSGVFTCEYAGLYHISVTIMTKTSHAYFEVRKNKLMIVPGYIPDHDKQYNSGTINTVVEMNVNDKISVWKGNVKQYYSYYSCFTIVKL